MRHRITDKKFNRPSNQRRSLFRALLRSLILERSMSTTLTKANALKRQMDRLIRQAKLNTLGSRRLLQKTLVERSLVNTLCDVIAPSFKSRTSGFVVVTPTAKRRGDNVQMVRVTFADMSASTTVAATKPVVASKSASKSVAPKPASKSAATKVTKSTKKK